MHARSRPRPALAALALAALLVACGPAPTKDDRRAEAIERSFIGGFVGTLEYRDYSSDRMVTLPTRMRGTRDDDGRITLEFEYDEGGGRTERGSTVLDVEGASRELVLDPAGEEPPQRYRIERFAAFTGLGELIVTGDGEEQGKPVETRILFSVAPDRLTWTKDTRPPGGAYRMRHRYTMKRAR